MWQLELLSRVIPAFGALAKEFTECDDHDARLRQHAQDCYSDIVIIGWAVSVSRGEWASGMNDKDIIDLLMALESRFPTRWKPFVFTTSLPHEATAVGPGERKQFLMLNALTNSIESIGWGGFDECFELLAQPREKRKQYLDIMGRDVPLFHKNEKRDQCKRKKFLDRVNRAAKHLLDVYCKEHSGLDTEDFNLSQHPSHGMKELANGAYNLLERHWRCNCAQRAARPTGAREARLSLIRHRQLAPKMSSQTNTERGHLPAKFEVLLPVCKDSVEWKVTNVEVKNTSSQMEARTDRKSVNNDICQTLLQSETLQVDFLAENSGFWHLKPKLFEGINHHTAMESLHQLLGDGFAIPRISKYTPREQLILCYILANSMLYLYPGSWFQTAWSSNRVYFIRRVNSLTSPMLAFPYLSVELQQARDSPKDPPPHMQCHSHPVILALGIIFLEIATGTRFRRSREQISWQQCNKDNHQALQLLNDLEKQDRHNHTKRISSGLSKAIRSCLKLEPPPNFPSNQLLEEGPIRHYILSRIVHPLASELKDGYKVRLEELHDDLVLEKDKENLDDSGDHRSTSRRPSSPTGNFAHAEISTDAKATLVERRDLCLLGDREEPVDDKKKAAASEWFEWHSDALCRIAKLRISDISDAQRVKIAILDSGIELSQDHKDMYDTEPKMKYRSWVDKDREWRDEVGHGTHLAILLRKVAPNAVVHVARVFKRKPDIQKSAQTIAEAIQYAVNEWKVDIIVMSFGFGEEHKSLYYSIKKAAYSGVIMFAAASNDGKNRPGGVAWPAKDMNVICVHSGDGHGTPSTFTPSPQDNMKIMVLGECVNSAWPQKLRSPGDHKLMSGTSCAAPIAAGIAALILDYARGFLTQQEWKSLRRVDSMRRMFERMKDPYAGYWWIRHWELFDSKRAEGWIHGEIKSIL